MKTKLEIKNWLDANGTIDFESNSGDFAHMFRIPIVKVYGYKINGELYLSNANFQKFILRVEEINKEKNLNMIEF